MQVGVQWKIWARSPARRICGAGSWRALLAGAVRPRATVGSCRRESPRTDLGRVRKGCCRCGQSQRSCFRYMTEVCWEKSRRIFRKRFENKESRISYKTLKMRVRRSEEFSISQGMLLKVRDLSRSISFIDSFLE